MKKKFRSRIVAALVAVTALTCCFVGSTFAKYTSSQNQKATASVAKWQITNVSENNETINNFTFVNDKNKLSPAVTGTTNTLSTAKLEIQNLSDVAAEVKVTAPTVAVTVTDTQEAGAYKHWKTTEWGTYETVVDDVFTVSVAVTDASGTALPEVEGKDDTYLLAAKDGDTVASLYLTITFTWTTQTGDNGNAIDTFFGMYATDLVATLPLTATQSTKLPA